MKRLYTHLFLLLLAVTLLAGAPVHAADGGMVKVAVFNGPVTPVLAAYIDRAVAQAEAEDASALIIELDTPGGSVDITKGITQRITSARVPVIVYVAPSGALTPARNRPPPVVNASSLR